MQESESLDKLMTVTELAAFLSCAEISIYKLTSKGTTAIPHLRTPGGIRFEKKAVIEFFRHNVITAKV